MSLIEQAAKRLEELRRAGADLQETPPNEGVDIPAGETPTPEAVVRAIEARSTQFASFQGQRQDQGAVLRRPIDGIPETSRAAPRRADIDLDRLAALGFVTPNAPKS